MVSINALVYLKFYWHHGILIAICCIAHIKHTRFAFTLCVLQIDDLECEEIKIVT